MYVCMGKVQYLVGIVGGYQPGGDQVRITVSVFIHSLECIQSIVFMSEPHPETTNPYIHTYINTYIHTHTYIQMS